ncbi:hypothetical protein [Agromyces binzhouensis]|uniref:Uncharacterized protein n=1 Tax=Agromyces binzhouensis TaxID=1817495 RepID=A0A4Q2JEP7_9MICO|nr:hypothetical protein [Agromyces binzhouensis]RXZ46231.1 hypothetical protein ESO86_10985 [Agromyces binzhouensis]
MSDQEELKPGVSRRTVAKAMAWSVPAVALAVPAPAYAASGPPPDVLVGVACKLPGNSVNQKCADIFAQLPGLDTEKAYAIPLLVTNNTSKDIVLKPSISIISSGLPFNVVGIIPTYCTPIVPGDSVKVIVYANSDNSANTSVDLAITIPWGHDCADTDHAPIFIPSFTVDAFPPCSSNVPFPQGAPSCDPPFYQAGPAT